MNLFYRLNLLICIVFLTGIIVQAQDKPFSNPAQETAPKKDLQFPGLLKKKEVEAGNPLAAYAAMIELEQEYQNSKLSAGIYPEIRFNYEEFLGMSFAGLQAMQLPLYRKAGMMTEETSISKAYQPEKAIDVIEREAQKTRIVIWGEEHHLPQTRSLYEQLLKRLWKHGYRYLAAETFTDDVMSPAFKYPDYKSGYYLMDPVYASAVRTAIKIGYKLIAYDTKEVGPAGDASFRDRMQATNLKRLIFDHDTQARVLILAGRGHASEQVAQNDGWTPMASVLKKITGIDPFTIYAPTMNQRLNAEDEHSLYRFAVTHKLIKQPTIFVNENEQKFLGPEFCDAYVFFPVIKLIDGRPDWMMKELGRKEVEIPKQFLVGEGLRLVQAFEKDEPDSAVPVDQIPISGDEKKVLMLPKGKYRLRIIDKDSCVLNQAMVFVD